MYSGNKIYTIWAKIPFLKSELLRDLGFARYWMSYSETNVGRLAGVCCTDIPTLDYIISALVKHGVEIYSFKRVNALQKEYRQATEDELRPYLHDYVIDSSKQGLDAITYVS